MKIGDQTRHIISKGQKAGHRTEQVVYKTFTGNWNGKARFLSRTRHERTKP